MAKSTPILTTHVGSLIRPQRLVEFMKAKESNQPIDTPAFNACLQESVNDIVKKQADAGLDIISDGEYGKTWNWSLYITDRLSGIEHRPLKPGEVVARPHFGKDRRDFAEFYALYDASQPSYGKERAKSRRWTIVAPITYTGNDLIKRDIESFQSALKGVQVSGAFIPAVSPASAFIDRADEIYRTDEEFLFAFADALNTEYRQIVDAGFVLQIDDSYFASYYDVIVPPGTLSDYRKWAALRVEAINYALRGIPEEKARFHVCWGSWNSPHASDVPLKNIIDMLFKIKVGGYSIEMANPRHEHEWSVFANIKLPEGKTIIPGVVSHQTNVVEHPELVAERLTRLAQLIGAENLIASTDCGFAQGPFLQRVHPSIQWAKLAALVEGTKLANRALG